MDQQGLAPPGVVVGLDRLGSSEDFVLNGPLSQVPPGLLVHLRQARHAVADEQHFRVALAHLFCSSGPMVCELP